MSWKNKKYLLLHLESNKLEKRLFNTVESYLKKALISRGF